MLYNSSSIYFHEYFDPSDQVLKICLFIVIGFFQNESDIWLKILDNSGFAVSELVVGFCERDKSMCMSLDN